VQAGRGDHGPERGEDVVDQVGIIARRSSASGSDPVGEEAGMIQRVLAGTRASRT